MKQNILKELCLEITDLCPMNCIHCSNGNSQKDMLNFNEIMTIINDFDNLGGQILEISGGEPLEHPNLLKIIRHAKRKGLEVRLYTSGLISQNSEFISITYKLANSLKKSGLDKIIFNTEGAKPETHEIITNLKGSYQKAIDSITATISVKLWTGIHFVPTKLNFKEIEQAIEISSALGVSEFALLRFVPQGRGLMNREKLDLSDQEQYELISILNKIKTNQQINIRIGHHFSCLLTNDFKGSKCLAGKSACLIKPNGDVVPCPALKNNGFKIGSTKKESLIELWHKSEAIKQFRSFNYEDLIHCRNCISLSQCQGGCTAQRILACGDLSSGRDPLCPRKKFESIFGDFTYTKVLSPLDRVAQE